MKRYSILQITAGLGFLVLLTISCTSPHAPGRPEELQIPGSLSVTMGRESRELGASTTAIGSVVTASAEEYEITLQRESFPGTSIPPLVQSLGSIPGEPLLFEDVVPGTWSVTAVGRTADGEVVVEGTRRGIIVESQQTVVVTLVLFHIGSPEAQEPVSEEPAEEPAPADEPGDPEPAPIQEPSSPRSYEIGDAGPAGGLIVYRDLTDQFEWTYLELAPEETEWAPVNWGGSGMHLGINDSKLGSGARNTQEIVSALDSGVYAAYRADTLEHVHNGEVFTDWFLPSKGEMSLVFENELIPTQGYSYLYYWTSTERHGTTAWVVDLVTGNHIGGMKENSSVVIRARAMRSF